MKVDNGVTNFAVYENATEFCGTAEVTLPEFTEITEEIKGAGISGVISAGYVGHFESLTATFNFRTVTKDAIKLLTPGNHHLDLRAAQQYRDNTTGKYVQEAAKHILIAAPTKFAPGKLAPASLMESSVEMGITYYALYIANKKVMEVDIVNFIYEVDGVDYLADVRKALGKQ